MPNVSKWDELPYIDGGDSTNAIAVSADWDISDESNPAAIKNKPFGMIEQIVKDVEAEYNFEKPHDMTTDIVCFSVPDFNSDLFHDVWFNGIYLGTAKPQEMIEIPNGQFYISLLDNYLLG